MKRVQFSVTYPDELVHPFHQHIIANGPITRAELLIWSPTEDATTLFWCDGSREAMEKAIQAIDSLVVSKLVEDGTGTYAFLRQDDYEFATVILDTISDARVVFMPPVVFLASGAIQFEAVGESTALSSFTEELSDLGELTIQQVHEFERTNAPSQLTDRQRAALDAAVAVGYYEIPREGTITDIATRLGCSSSTAGELVRKAEAAVIRDYIQRR